MQLETQSKEKLDEVEMKSFRTKMDLRKMSFSKGQLKQAKMKDLLEKHTKN